MLKYLPLFLICIVAVDCQNWVTRACLVNHSGYFMKIMQEVASRLENNIKWCNFEVNDVNQQINENLFKWHAQGTANYTNGFLVHIQNIDVTNIMSSFSSTVQNETTENFVSVNGILNFRNFVIGYDVVADIDGFDTQYYTGVMPYTLLAIRCWIGINLKTKEATVTTTMTSSTAAERRMTYRPQNKIAELLSRHFAAYHISLSPWGTNYIAPLIMEVLSETELPEIRFDNRC